MRFQNVSRAPPAITLKGSCASHPCTNEPVTASDPDFPYPAPAQAACAACVQESRIKSAQPTNYTGNPGEAPLPCKAYHDESLLRSRLIDAVPWALIVYAVLLCDSVVSVLDMRVGFDYPKPALEGMLLQITHVVSACQDLLRGLTLSASRAGFSNTVLIRMQP